MSLPDDHLNGDPLQRQRSCQLLGGPPIIKQPLWAKCKGCIVRP